ncbi:MAG: hypothetical protein FJ100_05205 [Deltaproteobacteria bacterium]|nr:hypothetical protein [Deltaproteobacteria bacterium]
MDPKRSATGRHAGRLLLLSTALAATACTGAPPAVPVQGGAATPDADAQVAADATPTSGMSDAWTAGSLPDGAEDTVQSCTSSAQCGAGKVC